MSVDAGLIERAHHLAQSGANPIREQVALIREMRTAGRPSDKAEEFLIPPRRAHCTFQHDLESLRNNPARRHP